MSSEHEMPDSRPADAPLPSPGLSGARASRRRLLQGGLAAAPVVLSVSSRPVMAATGACSTASAFGSINASRPNKVTSCGGCKPDYWKNTLNYSLWPAGHCATAKTVSTDKLYFNEVFASSPYPSTTTLLQVLQTTGTGQDAVARHCVAAVLNAAKGLTPATVLSAQVAKDVWASYRARGYYEPTAGIKWYPDSSIPSGTGSILQWLVSTMPN
jgi:hypothetical protein